MGTLSQHMKTFEAGVIPVRPLEELLQRAEFDLQAETLQLCRAVVMLNEAMEQHPEGADELAASLHARYKRLLLSVKLIRGIALCPELPPPPTGSVNKSNHQAKPLPVRIREKVSFARNVYDALTALVNN